MSPSSKQTALDLRRIGLSLLCGGDGFGTKLQALSEDFAALVI